MHIAIDRNEYSLATIVVTKGMRCTFFTTDGYTIFTSHAPAGTERLNIQITRSTSPSSFAD